MSAGRGATWRSDTPLNVAAALSLLAAIVHLWAAAAEHFEEWWGYGTFLLACAGAQGLYAVGLLRRPGRPLFRFGVAGNLAIVILWLVTRTTGVPLLGPHAGEIEDVGLPDLACTLAEVGIVVGLGALVMRGLPTERRIQVVVVLAVSGLLFWHLLHLLAGASAH